MAPFYQKPENALKRAEDLVAVNQPGSALTLLHETILSKRARSTPIPVLEPIVLKFVELSVDLGKGKTAREGLFQYKNITQNIQINTIETIIKHFLTLAKQSLDLAQKKAQEFNIALIEDLEANETPEQLMMFEINNDQKVITPALRFLWEAYRTSLDTLRNNSRLESLYQIVAKDAFGFCIKFERKLEFKRLCDILRQHLSSASKYAHQPNAIDLSDDETLQRHVDIRFAQLKACADMELWQEGFRSIEDVYQLLQMTKKAPKLFMQAKYYEILNKVLMVGGNYLFHAAAYQQYFNVIRHKPDVDLNAYADVFLVSALSVPIIRNNEEDKDKAQRLTDLLNVTETSMVVPTREILLQKALTKNILNAVRPEIKELYELLEVQFHPLSICKKVAPIMEKFEKDPSLSKYVKPLNEIILTRLLQQLSQVYSEIKISSVCKLTSNFDRFQIEKFVMNGCRRGEFLIRIDQQKQSLCFEKCVFREKVERTSSFPVDDMLSKLDKFAKSLEVACGRIDPFVSMKREKANLNAFKLAAENADLDRQTTVERRFMIEQKLEQKQEELNALEQNRQAKAYELQVLEEQRLAQQEKVLAVERMNTQRKEIERSEALKLAEKIAAELREKNVKIKDDEITDTDKLIELQVQQLEKEKRILAQKSHTITKLLDHQIRAFRIEEIPLLEQDYLKQCVEDEKVWNQRVKLAKETNEVKEELNRKMLERFEEIRDDYEEYKQIILQESEEKYEQLVKEAEEKIEQEKKQRIENYEREQAEEEERRIQYEKEQEESRLIKEKKDKIQKEKDLERDQQRAKLDEIARIQREKELSIEEKLAGGVKPVATGWRSKTAASVVQNSAPPIVIPPVAGGWRSKQAAAKAEEPSEEKNVYRPPGASARGAASRGPVQPKPTNTRWKRTDD